MKNNWKSTLDPIIRTHLDVLIRESSRFRNSYSNSKNVSNAQLWVALALASKQIADLNLKIKFLEKALQELSPGKSKKTTKKDEEDIKKVLDSLQKM